MHMNFNTYTINTQTNIYIYIKIFCFHDCNLKYKNRDNTNCIQRWLTIYCRLNIKPFVIINLLCLFWRYLKKVEFSLYVFNNIWGIEEFTNNSILNFYYSLCYREIIEIKKKGEVCCDHKCIKHLPCHSSLTCLALKKGYFRFSRL